MARGPSDVMHVSCAVQGRYIPHSAAMLHSVLGNRGSCAVQIHYLHGPTFPRRSAARLAGMVEDNGGSISFIEIPDAAVAGLPVIDRFTSAMWYRIMLPELLADVDRVLYLDVDTIAVDSLEPLWQTDLEGYLLGAVTNVLYLDDMARPSQLGLAGPEEYFNSGVLLLNLEEMRRRGASAAMRAFATEHGQSLIFPDQDTLNAVLGRQRLPLHPRWNFMSSVVEFPWSVDVLGRDAVEEARRAPAIRHFEGPRTCKPWHFLCDMTLREQYFQHRRQTPWPRVRLEGVTPLNVAKRCARMLGIRRSRLPAQAARP